MLVDRLASIAEVSNFPYLSLLAGVPLVGALIVALLPRTRPNLAKLVALAFSLARSVDARDVVRLRGGRRAVPVRESYPWIPTWDARFTFALDGIALVVVALIAVFVPLVIIYSWHEVDADRDAPAKRSVPAFFALILALESTMLGVFVAADVFLFYVFFEVMLVPMYFLIGSYGGARRQYAAVKFFLYSLVGGLFMLAAVIGLWVLGGHTFDWQKLTSAEFSAGAERWLFLGFFLAFAIKAPFFPFHTWLPDAGGAAPAGAAALLVGVLDKVGTFGILRYCLPLFPNASKYFAPLGLALALIGIIYAALLAVGQNDLKRLVSYTSVAHFGFIGIGIFAYSGGLNRCCTWSIWPCRTALLVVGMFVRVGSALVGDFGAGKTRRSRRGAAHRWSPHGAAPEPRRSSASSSC
jgi:NADH-quinone oxidoreductase subunit M